MAAVAEAARAAEGSAEVARAGAVREVTERAVVAMVAGAMVGEVTGVVE